MPEETTRSDHGPTDDGVSGGSRSSDVPTAPSPPSEPRSEPSRESSSAPSSAPPAASDDSVARVTGRFVKELVIIVAIALIASALLRAFVVQAFFVPSGSMLPTIQLNDRILVTRIGDVDRGEVVVFEDPGGWIPANEQAPPPDTLHKALEFVGVLPASGHEHLVKRAIGLPGDHVVCCERGRLVINGTPVDESGFLNEGNKAADNVEFDVIVPKDHIFVLGDNRYVSGDSSRHLDGQGAFIPMDLVTGRAFAVIWPFDHRKILRVPDAYDDVPDGGDAPSQGVINEVSGAGG